MSGSVTSVQGGSSGGHVRGVEDELDDVGKVAEVGTVELVGIRVVPGAVELGGKVEAGTDDVEDVAPGVLVDVETVVGGATVDEVVLVGGLVVGELVDPGGCVDVVVVVVGSVGGVVIHVVVVSGMVVVGSVGGTVGSVGGTVGSVGGGGGSVGGTVATVVVGCGHHGGRVSVIEPVQVCPFAHTARAVNVTASTANVRAVTLNVPGSASVNDQGAPTDGVTVTVAAPAADAHDASGNRVVTVAVHSVSEAQSVAAVRPRWWAAAVPAGRTSTAAPRMAARIATVRRIMSCAPWLWRSVGR